MTIMTPSDALLGNPPSAAYQPKAVDLVNLLDQHAAAISLSNGPIFRDTLGELQALTGVDPVRPGFVVSDSTSDNNGIYETDGVTWTKVASLPAIFAGFTLADVATTGDSDDLTEGGTNLLMTAAERTKIGHVTISTGVDLDVVAQKVGFITVTANRDLDAMAGQIATLSQGNDYSGTWDATSGAFPSGATKGDFYVVSVAGTVDGESFIIGDTLYADVISPSTTTFAGNWSKVPNFNSVTSVAGRTGAVVLTKADVGLGNVDDTADADKPLSIADKAALDVVRARAFSTTGNSDLTVVKGTPTNGITLTWSARRLRLPDGGLITVSAGSNVALSPGQALVVDISGGVTATMAATIDTSFTQGDEQTARDGDTIVLVEMRTNEGGGLWWDDVLRALDYSREKTALDGLAWTLQENSAQPVVSTAVKSGNNLNVGWSLIKVDTPAGERDIAARSAAVLNAGQCLYVNTQETYSGSYTVVQAAFSASIIIDVALGLKFLLVHAGTGRFSGALENSISSRIQIDARVEALATLPMGPLQVPALASVLHLGIPRGHNRQLGPRVINGGNNWVQDQAGENGRIFAIANTNTRIDVEWFPEGGSRTYHGASAGKVVFPVNPIGKAGNQAALGADVIIRVTQLGTIASPKYLVEELAGTPTWSTVSRGAMDRSIAVGGQSLSELFFTNGGIGGFTSQMLDRYGTNFPSTYWINGATSGSSIYGASGWWNSGSPGAALTNYLDALDAAVAASQPKPVWTLWNQGQADVAAALGTYKTTLKAVFDYIRAYDGGTYSDMKFIVVGPQAEDDEINFGGAMDIRVALIELAEENAWIYPGPGSYDVPRPWDDVHAYDEGLEMTGYRTARALLVHEGDGSITDYGPEIDSVGAVSETNGIYSVTVTVTASIDKIVIPWGSRGVGEDTGPYPFGWCAINGDPRTTAPIALRSGSITRVSDTEIDVTFTATTDLVGARLYTFAGYSLNARSCNFIRNDKAYNGSRGIPMRDQRTAVLA